MKKINDEECNRLITRGSGIFGFMGGLSTKNGSEIVIVGDDMFYFSKREMEAIKAYDGLMKIQRKEANDFIKEKRKENRTC